MNNSEKIKSATKSLNAFIDKFGERDIYSKLVIEMIFEELNGKKQSKQTLSVPSEKRQEGNETVEHFPLQRMPTDESYRH
jgi:hypothetical protein